MTTELTQIRGADIFGCLPEFKKHETWLCINNKSKSGGLLAVGRYLFPNPHAMGGLTIVLENGYKIEHKVISKDEGKINCNELHRHTLRKIQVDQKEYPVCGFADIIYFGTDEDAVKAKAKEIMMGTLTDILEEDRLYSF